MNGCRAWLLLPVMTLPAIPSSVCSLVCGQPCGYSHSRVLFVFTHVLARLAWLRRGSSTTAALPCSPPWVSSLQSFTLARMQLSNSGCELFESNMTCNKFAVLLERGAFAQTSMGKEVSDPSIETLVRIEWLFSASLALACFPLPHFLWIVVFGLTNVAGIFASGHTDCPTIFAGQSAASDKPATLSGESRAICLSLPMCQSHLWG